MFYTYDQNNSGGGFEVDEERGISHFVIVEADSAEEADSRAEGIGIYFDDGYEIDCECCGSRWNPSYGSGDEVPEVYGDPAETHRSKWKWIDGPEGYIHYLDGTIKPFWEEK